MELHPSLSGPPAISPCSRRASSSTLQIIPNPSALCGVSVNFLTFTIIRLTCDGASASVCVAAACRRRGEQRQIATGVADASAAIALWRATRGLANGMRALASRADNADVIKSQYHVGV